MSFDYNPFEHIEIVRMSKGIYSKDDKYCIHCHSCGGSIPRASYSGFRGYFEITTLFAFMKEHVEVSHNRTEASFIGWSNY